MQVFQILLIAPLCVCQDMGEASRFPANTATAVGPQLNKDDMLSTGSSTIAPSTDATSTDRSTIAPSTDATSTDRSTIAPSTDATSTDRSTIAPSTDATSTGSTSAPSGPLADGNEILGYYSLSWNEGNKGPKNSNTSVYFNGWNNVAKGLDELDSENQRKLVGFKYFSFGGGDHKSGYLDVKTLKKYMQNIDKISKAGFQGVMFDVEIVHGSFNKVQPVFAEAFAKTKQAGLRVGITTSHSAPVIVDKEKYATQFVEAWVQDENVDVMSPQLYENGNEDEPQLQPTSDCVDEGCTYDMYKKMHPGMQFAPSITYAKQYSKVQKYFKSNFGIECAGYFVYYENDRRLNPLII